MAAIGPDPLLLDDELRHRRSGPRPAGMLVLRCAPIAAIDDGFVRSAQPCWVAAPTSASPDSRRRRAAGQERRRRMPRLGRTLAARILLAVLGIVVVTMAVGFALFARLTSQTADAQAIEQATRHRGDPGRVAAGRAGGRGRRPRPRAAGARRRRCAPRPGASYVVIIDRDGRAVLPPQPGPDRPAHRGAGGRPRRPGAHRHRPGQPRPLRQRPGARSSTPTGRRSARCRSASSSPRSASGSTHEVLDIALYTGARPRARRRGLAAARPRRSSG